jgi:hypothetical protein
LTHLHKVFALKAASCGDAQTRIAAGPSDAADARRVGGLAPARIVSLFR